MHTILELLYLPKNVNFLLKYQPTFSKPLLYAKSWHLRNCYRRVLEKKKGTPSGWGCPGVSGRLPAGSAGNPLGWGRTLPQVSPMLDITQLREGVRNGWPSMGSPQWLESGPHPGRVLPEWLGPGVKFLGDPFRLWWLFPSPVPGADHLGSPLSSIISLLQLLEEPNLGPKACGANSGLREGIFS